MLPYLAEAGDFLNRGVMDADAAADVDVDGLVRLLAHPPLLLVARMPLLGDRTRGVSRVAHGDAILNSERTGAWLSLTCHCSLLSSSHQSMMSTPCLLFPTPRLPVVCSFVLVSWLICILFEVDGGTEYCRRDSKKEECFVSPRRGADEESFVSLVVLVV